MGLSFDHPELLHVLWVVPALGMVYLWGFAHKRRAMEKFASLHLVAALIPDVSVARQKVKAVIVCLAAIMLVTALTGPRWGAHWEELERRGVDIMFVLDVSKSMLAEDVKPSRLERAKLDMADMLSDMHGDRVGLVTFAGQAVVTCPLTINYGAFRLALDDVTTRSSPRGGTNIGDAVRLAAASFTDRVKDHKAIIVISDGDETDDSYAVEAAQKAFEEKGIRVFAIGFGDMREGGRIPIIQNGQRVYLKYQNQEHWTKLHPTLMQSMAGVADGGYFTNTDFREIHERIIQKVEARTFETSRRELRYARFHWFAAAALVLLMIETMMTDRKAREG
jgi:Ca-activated chloride channel homolog